MILFGGEVKGCHNAIATSIVNHPASLNTRSILIVQQKQKSYSIFVSNILTLTIISFA